MVNLALQQILVGNTRPLNMVNLALQQILVEQM